MNYFHHPSLFAHQEIPREASNLAGVHDEKSGVDSFGGNPYVEDAVRAKSQATAGNIKSLDALREESREALEQGDRVTPKLIQNAIDAAEKVLMANDVSEITN